MFQGVAATVVGRDHDVYAVVPVGLRIVVVALVGPAQRGDRVLDLGREVEVDEDPRPLADGLVTVEGHEEAFRERVGEVGVQLSRVRACVQ